MPVRRRGGPQNAKAKSILAKIGAKSGALKKKRKKKMTAAQIAQDKALQNMESSEEEDSGSSSAEWFSGASDDPYAYGKGGYLRCVAGQVLNKRYVIQKRLGWGHFSMVWLAIDKQAAADDPHRLVALKIQKSASDYCEAAEEEIEFLQHIRNCTLEHEDKSQSQYVAQLLDSFATFGDSGKHFVMVFPVLGKNVYDLIEKYDYAEGFPLAVVKMLAKDVLEGLQFLHEHAHVILTDIKPENVLLTRIRPFDMTSIEREQERARRRQQKRTLRQSEKLLERGKLSKGQKKRTKTKIAKLHKQINALPPLPETPKDAPNSKKHEIIFDTLGACQHRGRATALPSAEDGTGDSSPPAAGAAATADDLPEMLSRLWNGSGGGDGDDQKEAQPVPAGPVGDLKCILTDFGTGCWMKDTNTDALGTRQYRAPEAILRMAWSCEVDIWSTACMCFEFATGEHLYDPDDDDRGNDDVRDENHLALIARWSGRFPRNMREGSFARRFWNRKGEFKTYGVVEDRSLLDLIKKRLPEMSQPQAELFHSFLEPMIRTDPSERAPAAACLEHPFLTITAQDRADVQVWCDTWIHDYVPPDSDEDETDEEDEEGEEDGEDLESY